MKYLMAVLFFTAAFAVSAVEQNVQQACTDLVLDYAYYRDRPDAAGFANLFASDGKLTVNGETFEGRKAIHDRLANNADGTTFRHMMSTIRIFEQSPTRATGVSYVAVYLAPPGHDTVESFAAIGEYHDEFVLTQDGWKIKEREFVSVFRYADQP